MLNFIYMVICIYIIKGFKFLFFDKSLEIVIVLDLYSYIVMNKISFIYFIIF